MSASYMSRIKANTRFGVVNVTQRYLVLLTYTQLSDVRAWLYSIKRERMLCLLWGIILKIVDIDKEDDIMVKHQEKEKRKGKKCVCNILTCSCVMRMCNVW